MAITNEELSELLEKLGKIRGRHTELITVYAPAGSNINQLSNQIASEQSTAQNIKSKSTRTNVIDALEKLIRYLKLYKDIPKNGLALFCGNISKQEGQPDLKIWAIEPPTPLNVKFYRCDQTFVVEPLKQMLESIDVYGLLVLDRREATFGLLDGKSVVRLKHLTSGVPGKIKAGGQSAARFERLTEEAAKEFYRRIAESAKDLFFSMPKLKGILLGGPGHTKDEFLAEGNLLTDLKKKIVAIKDVSYTNDEGLEELVDSAKNDLRDAEVMKEKELLDRFFMMLNKKKDKVAYGRKDVERALDAGAVDTLIISAKEISREDQNKLKERANLIGATVEFVSNETQEGSQFNSISKGLGAILRFAINKD